MNSKPFVRPLLMIAGAIICLAMLRLGVWQLDRAGQKRLILAEQLEQTDLPDLDLNGSFTDITVASRFRRVRANGIYLADKSIFLDNQVHNSKVGYHLVTPFQLAGSDTVVLVNRGWVSVGDSRAQLPSLPTPLESLQIAGRLNQPTARPPLWDDDFPVADGALWQYLPIREYAAQLHLKSIPLVLELAPGQQGAAALIQQWPEINDAWVAKHSGYAFQWFAMALVFFLACLVLLFNSVKNQSD